MPLIEILHHCDDCEYKEPNKKGVRHRTCCFHDEPGITVCTCDPIRPSGGGTDG